MVCRVTANNTVCLPNSGQCYHNVTMCAASSIPDKCSTSSVYSNSSQEFNGESFVDYDLMELYELNRSITQPWYALFAVAYAILVMIAFTGKYCIFPEI